MALQLLTEREIPDEQLKGPLPEAAPAPAPRQPQVETATEKKSDASLTRFQISVAILGEIRRVLNARVASLLALLGAIGLTAWAMRIETPMALSIAVSFDILVYLPVMLIAYVKPKG